MALIRKLLLSLGVLSLSSAGYAATTAVLNVSAALEPVACSVSLSNGGLFDYGAINQSTLSATKPTRLPELSLPLTINCSAPALVSLEISDAAAASVMSSQLDADRLPAAPALGLGTNGAAKLGGYVVSVSDLTLPSAEVLTTNDGNAARATWVNHGRSKVALSPQAGFALGFGENGQSSPTPISAMAMQLHVQATLNARNQLGSLSNAVALHGSAVITLKY